MTSSPGRELAEASSALCYKYMSDKLSITRRPCTSVQPLNGSAALRQMQLPACKPQLACDNNNGLSPDEETTDWAILLRPPATGPQHGDCSGLMSKAGSRHLLEIWHVELPDMHAMCMGNGGWLPLSLQVMALKQRHIQLGDTAVNAEPSYRREAVGSCFAHCKQCLCVSLG